MFLSKFLRVVLISAIIFTAGSTAYGAFDISVTDIAMDAECFISVTVANISQDPVQTTDLSNLNVQLWIDGNPWGGIPLGSAASGALNSPGGTFTFIRFLNKRVPDGTHSVKAAVDTLNYLPESNETNNQRTESFTGNCGVTLQGKPDAAVTGLTLDSSCKVKVTLKNAGTAGLPIAHYSATSVHIYKNNNILVSKNLATIDPSHTLNTPGASLDYTFTGADIGVGTSQIKASFNTSFWEQNKLNNNLTKSLTCQNPGTGTQPAQLPDFTIHSVSMRPDCFIDVVVKNTGTAIPVEKCKSISLQSYLDNSGWGGKSLDNIPCATLKNANSTYTFTKFMNKRVPDGSHQVKLTIDATNYLSEMNETNNQKIETFTGNCGVQPQGKPDVKMAGLSINRDCQVGITLQNIGTGGVPASNYSTSAVHLYKNNNILASRKFSQIDPSKALTTPGGKVNYVFTTGADIGKGTVQIKAMVNPSYYETNKINNSLTKSFTCGAPDLVITDVRERRFRSKIKGRPYSVKIKNNGNLKSTATDLVVTADRDPMKLEYKVPPLEPGASTGVTIVINPKVSGYLTLLLNVDSRNNVKESNENNNKYRERIVSPTSPKETTKTKGRGRR